MEISNPVTTVTKQNHCCIKERDGHFGQQSLYFKRLLGAVQGVYYKGVLEEAVGVCGLAQLPQGDSGSRKETGLGQGWDS